LSAIAANQVADGPGLWKKRKKVERKKKKKTGEELSFTDRGQFAGDAYCWGPALLLGQTAFHAEKNWNEVLGKVNGENRGGSSNRERNGYSVGPNKN